MSEEEKDKRIPVDWISANIAVRSLEEKLLPIQLKILRRWASGDDTSSTANHFGIPVDMVEEVKTLAIAVIKRTVKLSETSGYNAEESEVKKWVLDFLTVCEHCGTALHGHAPFCAHCGQTNPLFDESIFEQRWGDSLQVVRKEDCEMGHPGRKKHPELWREDPYCVLCGKIPPE